jgi:hypothetical protein
VSVCPAKQFRPVIDAADWRRAAHSGESVIWIQSEGMVSAGETFARATITAAGNNRTS